MKEPKKKAKDGNIHMDRNTYRLMLQVYKKHSAIPFHEKIIITGKEEKDVKT